MTPAPAAGTSWNSTLRRTAWGAKKRTTRQTEKAYSVTVEELFGLHRLDYWHCTVAQASQPGWPDYVIFGTGWLAFMELKARNPITKRAGRVDDFQRRYRDSIEAAGGEWRTFLLMDDWDALCDWLTAKTGIEARSVTR